MFARIFGEKNPSQSAGKDIPAIRVIRIVPIGNETKDAVRSLLMDEGPICDDNPHIAQLKSVPLREEYHRAGGYLTDKNGQERSSMWVQRNGNGMVIPETMVMFRERLSNGVYQPDSVMYGEKAMFGMVFKPPCCTGIESLLAVFVAKTRDGQSVSVSKVIQSAEALKQGVAEYFRVAVTIGSADNDLARLQMDETYKHLMDIDHSCAASMSFPPAYRKG